MPRPRSMGSRTGTVLLAAGLLGTALLGAGCAGWRGARLYSSGTHALEHGHITQAVGDLEEAAQLMPQSSEVYNHLGIAYTQAGRADDARIAFERAVELDCSNVAAQRNLEAARAADHPPAGP